MRAGRFYYVSLFEGVGCLRRVGIECVRRNDFALSLHPQSGLTQLPTGSTIHPLGPAFRAKFDRAHLHSDDRDCRQSLGPNGSQPLCRLATHASGPQQMGGTNPETFRRISPIAGVFQRLRVQEYGRVPQQPTYIPRLCCCLLKPTTHLGTRRWLAQIRFGVCVMQFESTFQRCSVV